MTEQTSKLAIQLVERIGLPVILVGIFLYALWMRTNNFLAVQHEYATKQNEACDEQLAVLREIRDLMKGRPHE